MISYSKMKLESLPSRFLLVFVLWCDFLWATQGLTLAGISTQINQEEQYLTSQIQTTKTNIHDKISTKRSLFIARADSIKRDINNGIERCKIWSSQIDSILQHQINFVYQFQVCEMNSRLVSLSGTGHSLNELKRNVQKIGGVCNWRGRSCQPQVESLKSSLERIHGKIERAVREIVRDMEVCVAEKSRPISSGLEGTYNQWRSCR